MSKSLLAVAVAAFTLGGCSLILTTSALKRR